MALTRELFLEKLLKAYQRYYDIFTDSENVTAPFTAEAVFHSHETQYFLVKSAKLDESESHEYIFIASVDTLDEQSLLEFDEVSWSTGMSRVHPHKDHRNSDVILVILADNITPEAKARIKKLRHYKSYNHTFQGWSNYQLIAVEISSGSLVNNRQGQNQKKLFNNILKSIE